MVTQPAHPIEAGDPEEIRESTLRLNRSVLRAAKLLQTVGDHPAGATASTLAAETGLPRPTAFRLLLSLESMGLLVREGGLFSLGWEVVRLGRIADPYRGILPRVQLMLDGLAAQLGENVSYSVVTGPTTHEVIAEADGPYLLAIAKGWIGKDFQLHAGATGKMLLSHLSDEQLTQILPEHLEATTKYTITSRSSLLFDLAEVRARGFATTDNELEEGLYAITVAVHDAAGSPIGMISVSGLDQRMKAVGVDFYVNHLRAASAALAASLSGGVIA